MKIVKLCVYLSILVALVPSSYASESWTVDFRNSATDEVLVHIEKMFRFKPRNPEASCLQAEVSFYSDERWTKAAAPELIRQVMSEAGCSTVTFDRFTYTLGV